MTYDDEMVEAYAAPVPRYTSYPTAPNFHTGIQGEQVQIWLQDIPEDEAVSLYIHIPFCDRLCWFCGCHTKHVQKYAPIHHYLQLVYREITLVARKIGRRQSVSRLHLGGGSPSLLKPADLIELREHLDSHFDFLPDAEISVEFDPSDMSLSDVASFARFGVTRASLGVQDFDMKVQTTINRLQSFEQTEGVINALRDHGVSSVNIDALYGLPHQTETTLTDTLRKVVRLSPDRIALFGYAHVPWIKTHQRLIPEDALPSLLERFRQARLAEEILRKAGYVAIGFDHFAKPNDGLAVAARQAELRRNFQGYTADNCDTLIGFGTSSISQYARGYAQNTKSNHAYARALDAGTLPIERGIALSLLDEVTAAAIESLMCDFKINASQLRARFGQAADHALRKASMVVMRDEDDIFRATEDGFVVTEKGRPFVRSIAACLDDYLSKDSARYSVAV